MVNEAISKKFISLPAEEYFIWGKDNPKTKIKSNFFPIANPHTVAAIYQKNLNLSGKFLAKTISGILFYPIDTLRTVIRSDTTQTSTRLFYELYKMGPFRFYNGLFYYLIKSVPTFVIVNFIYSKLI
jgi:hypothetical protein